MRLKLVLALFHLFFIIREQVLIFEVIEMKTRVAACKLTRQAIIRHYSAVSRKSSSREMKVEKLFLNEDVYRPIVQDEQFYHPWPVMQRSAVSRNAKEFANVPPQIDEDDGKTFRDFVMKRRSKEMQREYLLPVLDKELPILPINFETLNSPRSDSLQVTWYALDFQSWFRI
jgi:hypothetical protein